MIMRAKSGCSSKISSARIVQRIVLTFDAAQDLASQNRFGKFTRTDRERVLVHFCRFNLAEASGRVFFSEEDACRLTTSLNTIGPVRSKICEYLFLYRQYLIAI